MKFVGSGNDRSALLRNSPPLFREPELENDPRGKAHGFFPTERKCVWGPAERGLFQELLTHPIGAYLAERSDPEVLLTGNQEVQKPLEDHPWHGLPAGLFPAALDAVKLQDGPTLAPQGFLDPLL